MNRDELVQKVADHIFSMSTFGPDQCCQIAGAAIDLILEEAAKVCPDVASAAAIRALKGNSQ